MNDKKNTKIKYDKGLRWPLFDILSRNNQPQTGGMTEGGWDRRHDPARTLGERDGNDEPLAEGNDNNNEYGEDGDIPNDDNEYVLRTSFSQRRPLRV